LTFLLVEGLSSKVHQQNKKDVKMQRREFIKLTAAASVFSALPLWSRSVFAASRPALPCPIF
jgi:hypothetical protein